MSEATDKFALLRERARKLAERGRGDVPRKLYERVAMVAVGGERYGLPLSYVREIIRATPISPIPSSPGFVLGVCSVRGELLCVIDLALLRGSGRASHAEFFALVEVAGRALALSCDEVIAIEDVYDDGLATSLLSGELVQAFTRAVTREHAHILDVERLLHSDQLSVGQREDVLSARQRLRP